MGQIWQLQEAKNKFSRLVEKARQEGPQFVTRHGKDAVVVLSMEDYQKIAKPETSLFHFLQSSPLRDIAIDIARDKSAPRKMDL